MEPTFEAVRHAAGCGGSVFNASFEPDVHFVTFQMDRKRQFESDAGGIAMSETVNQKPISKVWGVAAFLTALPISLFFDRYGRAGSGRAALVSFTMLFILVAGSWKDRRDLWFWPTVAALTVVHLVLIAYVPWTDRSLAAPMLWPFGVLDFGFVYVVFSFVRRKVGHNAQ